VITEGTAVIKSRTRVISERTAVVDLITRVIFGTTALVVKFTKYKPVLEIAVRVPRASNPWRVLLRQGRNILTEDEESLSGSTPQRQSTPLGIP
jgi:hypothetical protein